jgi:hypothetical protein
VPDRRAAVEDAFRSRSAGSTSSCRPAASVRPPTTSPASRSPRSGPRRRPSTRPSRRGFGACGTGRASLRRDQPQAGLASRRPRPSPTERDGPGWWSTDRTAAWSSLPSPPREMRPMWRDGRAPARSRGLGETGRPDLRLTGISESLLADRLGEGSSARSTPRWRRTPGRTPSTCGSRRPRSRRAAVRPRVGR